MNDLEWNTLESQFNKHHDPLGDDHSNKEWKYNCEPCDMQWSSGDNICPVCDHEVE